MTTWQMTTCRLKHFEMLSTTMDPFVGMLPGNWDPEATTMASLGASNIDPKNAVETVLCSSVPLSEFNRRGYKCKGRELIELIFTEPLGSVVSARRPGRH